MAVRYLGIRYRLKQMSQGSRDQIPRLLVYLVDISISALYSIDYS